MATAIIKSGTLVLAFVAFSAQPVDCCETLVRDAAFRAPRDVHRLCVMAPSGDPAAKSAIDRLSDWLAGDARDLNVELVAVDTDAADIRWTDYGIPSAPPSVPVVVLVGRNKEVGQNFVIDHWEPDLSADDLEALLSSPSREVIQQKLGQCLAVLLHVPAADSGDSGETNSQSTLNRAVERWSERTKLKLAVVRLDREDPRERLMLSFLGVRPDGPDWVGVVFGRGKLMAPPLVDAEITPERLGTLIDQLVQDCSCSKPLPSMGVDLPMLWNDELDETFVAISDPEADAEDGYVELALPDLSEESENSITAAALAEPTSPSVGGETSEEGTSPEKPVPVTSTHNLYNPAPTSRDGSLLTMAAWTVGILVFVVAFVSAAIFVRKGG